MDTFGVWLGLEDALAMERNDGDGDLQNLDSLRADTLLAYDPELTNGIEPAGEGSVNDKPKRVELPQDRTDTDQRAVSTQDAEEAKEEKIVAPPEQDLIAQEQQTTVEQTAEDLQAESDNLEDTADIPPAPEERITEPEPPAPADLVLSEVNRLSERLKRAIVQGNWDESPDPFSSFYEENIGKLKRFFYN